MPYASRSMSAALDELTVLAIDCQAGGATPEYGDLLELGWAVCGKEGLRGPVEQRFVVPRTSRKIAAAVRELTGWSEACLDGAVDERAAWRALADDIARVSSQRLASPLAPAVIHFARFELTFLRDLHARLADPSPFPLEPLCLHAIAARLFPDLPRRNIRALAGYLGHSPSLMRHCAAHVEATAFIWQALLPELAARQLHSLDDLAAFLAQPAAKPKSKKRVYPLAAERRRALPDRPGVYRFLRRNGDLLYVGKAASLKKRVAGHFRGGGQPNERALELLTQVHDIDYTQTPSILEAALLETDEIKRLAPPYNVQLRAEERQVWYASRDLSGASAAADDLHRIGPLPSQRALGALGALIALADGAEATPAIQSRALSVPPWELPEPALFRAGYAQFAEEHLRDGAPGRLRVDRAARALWLARRRAETDAQAADPEAGSWDLARVLRRLERGLTQGALLVRRARLLCLLAGADVAFREREMTQARALSLARGEIIARHDLGDSAELGNLPIRGVGTRADRQACFDAVTYDRLRVLATELSRVLGDGGTAALRIGRRSLPEDRLRQLMRWF